MKKCPYCAEEIQEEALLCRYCGKELGLPAVQSISNSQVVKRTQSKKVNNWPLVVIGVIIFGSLGIITICCVFPALFSAFENNLVESISTVTDTSLLALQSTAFGDDELVIVETLIPTTLSEPTSERHSNPSPTTQPSPVPTNTATFTPEPTNTSEPQIGSRARPIPMGQSFTILNNEKQEFAITVIRVVRGEEALQIMQEANMFNGRPPDGRDYTLIYLKADYLKGPDSESVLSLDDFDFHIVTKGNKDYSVWFAVPPNPEFDIHLFPGASGEGWIVKASFVDDTAPLMFYNVSLEPEYYFSLFP